MIVTVLLCISKQQYLVLNQEKPQAVQLKTVHFSFS